MATDLGIRLLPAFSTPTGIPYNRVREHSLVVSSLLMITGSLTHSS